MNKLRLLPFLLLAACDSPSAIDGDPRFPTGTYTLASIDNRALPTAEPCTRRIILEERITLSDNRANYEQRVTEPSTGSTFYINGMGTYTLTSDEVVADLTVTPAGAPERAYVARFVFERTADGFTQTVGMPCDGRSVKRFVMTSAIS